MTQRHVSFDMKIYSFLDIKTYFLFDRKTYKYINFYPLAELSINIRFTVGANLRVRPDFTGRHIWHKIYGLMV